MNKLFISFFFISCLFIAACGDDNEPVVLDNIVGTWTKQYPEGLQTEGFITWSFNTTGELDIRVYDVMAGDSSTKYDYLLSEDNNTITISGNIKNSDGEIMYDKFAVYDVVKLTKKELLIKQSWVNSDFDSLTPGDKNAFLLGGYKTVSFKRSK